MAFIPHFVQNEIDVSDDLTLLKTFNFCNPCDAMLPFADGTFSLADQEHLLGLVIGTTTASPFVPYPHARGRTAGMVLMRGGMQ